MGVRQHAWQVLIRAHPVNISSCWMAVCRVWLPHKLHKGPLSSFWTFQERAPPAAGIVALAQSGRPSKATKELSDGEFDGSLSDKAEYKWLKLPSLVLAQGLDFDSYGNICVVDYGPGFH